MNEELLEWISNECTEAHWLPVLNGAVEPDIEGLMAEGRRLADTLHRIGAAIHPERWVPVNHPSLFTPIEGEKREAPK